MKILSFPFCILISFWDGNFANLWSVLPVRSDRYVFIEEFDRACPEILTLDFEAVGETEGTRDGQN